jgi:hypothetical protein
MEVGKGYSDKLKGSREIIKMAREGNEEENVEFEVFIRVNYFCLLLSEF